MKTLALAGSLLVTASICMPAEAAQLALASSNIGNGLELLRQQLHIFEQQSGHEVSLVPMPDSSTEQFAQYKLWLSAQSGDVDVYLTDIVWAPQLADHFVDLADEASEIIGDFLPGLIESQTVDGKLVALPLFTSAPALFYRADLLERYELEVPQTWRELEDTANTIMLGERASGNDDFWGYVFQGSAYEGLTCNALEWIVSSGGGVIIDSGGLIAIDETLAAEALERAAGWIGTISPEGVLGYQEEEARGVWQLGNAAFMRNWPYAWTLGNFDDSPIKGKFGIAPLPHREHGGAKSAAVLGGWNVAVSRYSDEQEAAIDLARFLISAENQKERLGFSGDLPTLAALYEDDELVAEYPTLREWRRIFDGAIARPSAVTKADYNEVSAAIWSAAHAAMSEPGSATSQLMGLRNTLTELKGDGW